jgi:hypothetical protein
MRESESERRRELEKGKSGERLRNKNWEGE